MEINENAGVYELLTELCNKSASKYCFHSQMSQKTLMAKMRSQSYEVLLKKYPVEVQASKNDPVLDLLSYYFVLQANVKNVPEQKRCIELKKIICALKKITTDESDKQFNNHVLKFIISLKDTINTDLSAEMFQSPLQIGLLDEMLKRPSQEAFGSPQPYEIYPSYVFKFPFSLTQHVSSTRTHQSQGYAEYTVENFDSLSFLPKSTCHQSDLRTFVSPMSIATLASGYSTQYSDGCSPMFPRLNAPRDLVIPGTKSSDTNVEILLASSSDKSDNKEVFRAKSDDVSVDIWEIASHIDKDIPDNIWEIVSKMPPVSERQLIISSSREVRLWRLMYSDVMSDLCLVSEKQFIRHIMYLTIGIETSSFPYSVESDCFYMRESLALEGVSRECLQGYVASLLLTGTYYRRLFNFAFNNSLDNNFNNNGLVYESARDIVRRYLLEFRLKATEIFEDCFSDYDMVIKCLPTLLQILHHLEPMKYEIETVASIYKMTNIESGETIPKGAELMSYLFNEISLITHKGTAFTMFNSLFLICKVYFKFIERFIFEGELDDRCYEFFIRKDPQYVNCRSKRYWDKGFHITQSVAVPHFLKVLAKCILLCGKSLRLLKLCNLNDPLVVLISSDHPSIKCCASFEELEHQQQVLNVYRTRCLFVSGEPATFEQILLKREAERKAFTEMASIKQAETMEKIIAERKRLAQLIIAEKQHSLKVLEAAMAEAKAAKLRNKQREKIRSDLEEAVERSREEVDAKLKDKEKSKIMEYYSKLNMEVEKSKIHSEWKIKRLQLDQSRIQLLSTEERNLKREKFELEHKKSEENMAMSIQSLENKSDDEEVTSDVKNNEFTEPHSASENKTSESSNLNLKEVLNTTCNVDINIFRGSTLSKCDNQQQLDPQGNVISASEINSNVNIVNFTDAVQFDTNVNNQYLTTRSNADSNRQRVMSHKVFTDPEINRNPIAHVDIENNVKIIIDEDSPFEEAKRNKLKVLGTEFNSINIKSDKKVITLPTEAHRQALINKQRVLGVEYNTENREVVINEPLNDAQEEAIVNRKKVLGSQYDHKTLIPGPRKQSINRSGLTLNLKTFSDNVSMKDVQGITPNTGGVTPAEFLSRLDLETPTTTDVPFDSQFANELLTPQDVDTNSSNSNKKYLLSDGFNFPTLLVDEDTSGDLQTEDSNDSSPLKGTNIEISAWQSYDVKNNCEFDPFGVSLINTFRSETSVNSIGAYTHPAEIMRKVQRKPFSNIFQSKVDKEEDRKIDCDNIATLTACLQRSVMLPLTYQLEVVNNSILTHFLVNLDMYEHLRSLKDYFFLMDGEFSRSICHNLFAKLVKTINPQELLNFATLHNILDKALGSSISHVHKFSENLSFTISEAPLSFQHSSPDVLQCLSLTYTVTWPLNILLSQEALLRYAKVFQFLVKMRRISWVLGQDFERLKVSVKLSGSESRALLRSPQYRSVQIFRHAMASLIRALDSYIVTTCVLASWNELEGDLRRARTLDDLYYCHVTYIKRVLFRCLLNNRSTPVMKLLNDVFTVVLKFSRVLKAGEWQQKEPSDPFTHPHFNQLEELYHLFEKLAKYLHKVITRLMECGYQRHLVELLTTINLNGYYEPDRSKDTQNSSIQSN